MPSRRLSSERVPSDSPTRARLLATTNELFRRHGFNGTSLKAVTEAARAPIGSLYHFFPGGKVDLAEATLRSSGAAYQQLFEMIYDAAPDAVAAIGDFFDGAAATLEESDYVDLCPIGTVASEVASTNDKLRRVTNGVFSDWHDSVRTRLVGSGIAPTTADDLAVTLVAAIEGSFILARSARNPAPLHSTGRMMQRLVLDAIDPSASPRRR